MAYFSRINLLTILLVVSVQVNAYDPINFGHNMSPSQKTLAKGQWTAGVYFTGTGITDDLTVGVTPWLSILYNMENYLVKYRHDFLESSQLSHQFGYFKTNSTFRNLYIQESVAYWLTFGMKCDEYCFTTTLNYMYFFNETRPFSLRREPFNDDAHQFSLTTLHEFKILTNKMIQLEIGVLGLNYEFPNIHAGASFVNFWSKSFSTQFGFSFDRRYLGQTNDADYYYSNSNDRKNYIEWYENYKADAIHPEIHIQYWF